jgi:hypothetical protein
MTEKNIKVSYFGCSAGWRANRGFIYKICACEGNAFISHFTSHKKCILSQLTQQHCDVFSQKPYTVAVLEPGSSVSQADAMTTAPRRQGVNPDFLFSF